MNQEAQAFDVLAAILAEIRPRFGAAGFEDRRRVIGLLTDKAPQAKREIRAMGVAIDEGVPAALLRTERHLAGVEMDRLANSLEAATGLRLDLARRVVRSFAFALDLGPPPSVYEAASAPIAPPPAPVQPSGWTGLSTPVDPASSQPSQPVSAAYGAQPVPSVPVAPVPFVAAPVKRPNIALRVALGVGGFAAIALGVSQMMGGGGTGGGGGNVSPGNRTTTATTSGGGGGFAGELDDQGISPTVELVTDVASPTPLTISVGQRVSTAELQRMIDQDPQLILVDVLATPHQETLPRAVYLPSGGTAGSFQDSYQGDFAAGLAQATGGAFATPLVFFCAGPACWESHNAVLRANAAGYTHLFWYRGGLASWAEARLPMESQGQSPAQPAPAQQLEGPEAGGYLESN